MGDIEVVKEGHRWPDSDEGLAQMREHLERQDGVGVHLREEEPI